jgi:hypothetical protein
MIDASDRRALLAFEISPVDERRIFITSTVSTFKKD